MLARRAGLHARKSIRRKRKEPRRRPPEYIDEPYLAHLRLRPCRRCGCSAPNDPHHARHDEHGRSLGAHMKDDRRAISLCRICHGCIDELSGPFKGWTRARVHEWMNTQIADQRAQYLALSMVSAALGSEPVENLPADRSKNAASTQILD